MAEETGGHLFIPITTKCLVSRGDDDDGWVTWTCYSMLKFKLAAPLNLNVQPEFDEPLTTRYNIFLQPMWYPALQVFSTIVRILVFFLVDLTWFCLLVHYF